jgi:hypothetical protein
MGLSLELGLVRVTDVQPPQLDTLFGRALPNDKTVAFIKKGETGMLKKKAVTLVSLLVGAVVLSGCATMGDGIPPEKLGEYALIESHIGMRGNNMDTLPSSMRGMENTASIGWINGKAVFPANDSMNVLPGEYTFQVGIGCDNTATCRPGYPYKLKVKAGQRYVLLPMEVLVSDRSIPRAAAKEIRY